DLSAGEMNRGGKAVQLAAFGALLHDIRDLDVIDDDVVDAHGVGAMLDAQRSGCVSLGIEVNDQHAGAVLGEGGREIHRGRGLADPALLVRDRDHARRGRQGKLFGLEGTTTTGDLRQLTSQGSVSEASERGGRRGLLRLRFARGVGCLALTGLRLGGIGLVRASKIPHDVAAPTHRKGGFQFLAGALVELGTAAAVVVMFHVKPSGLSRGVCRGYRVGLASVRAAPAGALAESESQETGQSTVARNTRVGSVPYSSPRTSTSMSCRR